MQPFNPFLRSFFASKLPSQCTPPWHFVLLVPTADFLLNHNDLETQTPYSELVLNEEFLSSHVLRIQGIPFAGQGRGWTSVREGKAKTKQYTTLNGRAVVIKDNFVYTNRGFQKLNQAQLLQDEVYHADSADLSSWLIYSISRPLIGDPDSRVLSDGSSKQNLGAASKNDHSTQKSPEKKSVSSFNSLLEQFPAISKHMQPGLERILERFSTAFEDGASERTPNSSAATLIDEQRLPTDVDALTQSAESIVKLKRTNSKASVTLSAADRRFREDLEDLVLSAVDLFQSVDKQQLSLLAESTNLSGPVVESLIERYVAEQLHETVLFPKMLSSTHFEDTELEGYIKQMSDVDILQIGISDPDSFGGKHVLLNRVQAGINVFKKTADAGSPHEMLDLLLQTQQFLALGDQNAELNKSTLFGGEKIETIASMNADTLVSLLLIVVLRSDVHSLKARLMYMRDYIFFTDVESGHIGYALSTFEAVLSYLLSNSKALRNISHANRQLWRAIRRGDISVVKSMLDPTLEFIGEIERSDLTPFEDEPEKSFDRTVMEEVNGHSENHSTDRSRNTAPQDLRHVFPFMDDSEQKLPERQKVKKKVSMDARSISGSSVHSFSSISSTVGSVRSLIDDETTAGQLFQTQDGAGNSILFMALESRQIEVLRYLLRLRHFIGIKQVAEDQNGDRQTLLSAAIQLGDPRLIDPLMDFLVDKLDDRQIREYLASQDKSGRSAAHYCFSAPYLIQRVGHILPWQQKDKNGQTPLFAMCRSYDNENYHALATDAIAAATRYQGDGGSLQLCDHVDNKGNTLLHITNDANIVRHLLSNCKADPNAQNEKKLTPLMVASKYARLECIRAFFGDLRIDLQIRDARGLTAVEVAKDDDVRNRIDDMVLLLADPLVDNRRTTITRGILIDDGSVRLVLKSGAPSDHGTITVTTSRRSLQDFENLVSWLSLEQPASWLPSITSFRSPFQISPRPSKQVLRDIQMRLEGFLQSMLSHSTLGTHEMLWEFFLVPDVDWRSLAERAKRKAEIRVENLALDYTPLSTLSDVSEVSIFTGHAISQLREVHNSLKSVARKTAAIRNASADVADAFDIAAKEFIRLLGFVSDVHLDALRDFSASFRPTAFPPTAQFHYSILAAFTSSSALLQSLERPFSLIGSINSLRTVINSNASSSSSAKTRRTQSSRLLAGIGSLIDGTRGENADLKAAKAQREMETLGRELRYTQLTNAGELSSWQFEHGKSLKKGLSEFAKGMIVREKQRLDAMERAQRKITIWKTQSST